MFSNSFKIFTIFGFDIKLDFSWFFIAFIATWSLAKGYFPSIIPEQSQNQYWLMGGLGAFGLFFSILFHEIHHSLVAKYYKIKIKGITLFIFGGVAEMEKEPPSAISEFWIAIAGPFSSLYLGLLFTLAHQFAGNFGMSLQISAVFKYLGLINFVLAAFNMIPAFPLDGGRVLRAVLWKTKGDLKQATKIASQSGSLFGTVFILLAVVNLVSGNIFGAVWWFLIGMYLKNASSLSSRQVVLKDMLKGEPVKKFMVKNPVTVGPTMSIEELVQDYVYKTHHKMFPVLINHQLSGYIPIKRIHLVPQQDWATTPVHSIQLPADRENTIPPDMDTMDALALMNQTGNSRLMVAKDSKLVGILTLKDIMELLSLKMDLEEESR